MNYAIPTEANEHIQMQLSLLKQKEIEIDNKIKKYTLIKNQIENLFVNNDKKNNHKTKIINEILINDEQKTALHLCIEEKNLILLKYLLENNADPNVIDISGQTPLHHCILLKNKAMIKILLDHDADIYTVDSQGDSLIHLAIKLKSRVMLRLLLKEGAPVNIINNQHMSPLAYNKALNHNHPIFTVLENLLKYHDAEFIWNTCNQCVSLVDCVNNNHHH
eukprot:Pgem_evm1s4726